MNNLYRYSSGILVFLLFISLLEGCTSKQDNYYHVESCLVEGVDQLPEHSEGGDVQSTFSFDVFKVEYILRLSLRNELFKYHEEKNHFEDGIEVSTGENGETKLYNAFLSEEGDVELLESIIESIRNRSLGTEFEIVQLLTAFVQSIPYEVAQVQKYPYETLYLNKGDCSDKSVLLCKLLLLEGFDACLLSFSKAKHMAVGIRVPEGEEDYFDGYAYIETTAYHPIGVIPTELAGGIRITEDPMVIYPVDFGEMAYDEFADLKRVYDELAGLFGKEYLTSGKKGKTLLEEMSTLENKGDSLSKALMTRKEAMDSLEQRLVLLHCEGEVVESVYQECTELLNEHRSQVADYNLLVESLNEIADAYNKRVSEFNNVKSEFNSPQDKFDLALE